jgi:hypothetical protein
VTDIYPNPIAAYIILKARPERRFALAFLL